jgi:thiamine-phosphate diphosphorylase
MIASTSSYADSSASRPAVLSTIIPIVDSLEWIKKLSSIPGIMDIQLRLKGTKQEDIEPTIREAQEYVSNHCGGLKRLWINDYWKEAIAGKCFGVHLGQEDLAACVAQGGIEILQRHNIALGISSHTYAELSVAMSVQPSYISLGPVFSTTSKNVKFGPQGLTTVVRVSWISARSLAADPSTITLFPPYFCFHFLIVAVEVVNSSQYSSCSDWRHWRCANSKTCQTGWS